MLPGKIALARYRFGRTILIGITQALLLLVQPIPQKVCCRKQTLGKTLTVIPLLV